MSNITTIAATLAVSVLVVGYITHGVVQVPPGIEQPDEIMWIYASRKYIRAMGIIGEYLGLGHRLNISRALTNYFNPPTVVDTQGVQLVDEVFDGVPVRLYHPPDRSSNGPAMMWIHGGGWVWGSVDGDNAFCIELAKRVGITIVSVGYRLAPEFPFPTAVDDCEAASIYFLEHASEYDVNPSRVVIGGASAGGNLAAAVTLKMRDDKRELRFQHQILIVPCLQALQFNTPSYQLNANDAFLPKYWMIAYWWWYAMGHHGHQRVGLASENGHVPREIMQSPLGKKISLTAIPRKYIHESFLPIKSADVDLEFWEKYKSVMMNPYFAPLVASDLGGVPSAYVVTAQYDVLRDDGVLYARRLEKEGVKVVHKHYDKTFHAVTYHFSTRKYSGSVLQDLIDYLIQSI